MSEPSETGRGRIAAGTLYVAPDGDVLMLHRSAKEENFAGYWSLPGGKADGDETAEDAARRESAEEMGSAPEGKLKLLDKVATPSGMEFHTFAQPVETKFQPTLNEEHSGFTWAPLKALPQPIHPAVKASIDKALGRDVGTASDMAPEDWDGLVNGFLKWVAEEDVEQEHAEDDTVVKGALDSAMALDRAMKTRDRFALDRGTLAQANENRKETIDGRMQVKLSNISKACVNPYFGREIPNFEALGLDPDRTYYLYRDPIELKKAVPTFNEIPLLLRHEPSTPGDHPRDITVGTTGSNAKFEAPYLQNSLTIWDAEGIEAVNSKKQHELSPGYRYTAVVKPGVTPDGEAYDIVMTEIFGNHLCLVEEGRTGPDVVVGDANPFKQAGTSGDSVENGNMTAKTKLSRTGSAANVALTMALRPKLAADAKLNLAPIFAGVTKANYASKRSSIKIALDGALASVKGKFLSSADPKKMANDAEAGEVIKAAAQLVDMFDPSAMEGMDDDPDMGSMDDKPVWSAEDQAAFDELCEKRSASGAMDEDDETEEERKARMAKRLADKGATDGELEAGKTPDGAVKPSEVAAKDGDEPVTKGAMDARLAQMARDSKAETERVRRETEVSTMQRMEAIATARELVDPLVGKVVVACDSAEAVYKHTLTSLGIAADGINVAGMKALIEQQLAHKGTPAPRKTAMAVDSSVAGARAEFEKAQFGEVLSRPRVMGA